MQAACGQGQFEIVVIRAATSMLIRCADWLIDLAPRGQQGGEIVAAARRARWPGTPAAHTGRYLKGVLAQHPAVAGATV